MVFPQRNNVSKVRKNRDRAILATSTAELPLPVLAGVVAGVMFAACFVATALLFMLDVACWAPNRRRRRRRRGRRRSINFDVRVVRTRSDARRRGCCW